MAVTSIVVDFIIESNKKQLHDFASEANQM